MTLEQAREVARNPVGRELSELVGALAALGREVDRRESLALEESRRRLIDSYQSQRRSATS